MVGLSYIAVVTSDETRSSYIAVGEAAGWIGEMLGFIANAFIIDQLGLDKCAYTTSCMSAFSVLIAVMFVVDTTGTSNHHYTWRDIFNFSHLFDGFRIITKKRPGYKRLLLNLTVLMYSLPVVVTNFYVGGSFLFFVKFQGFSITEFSLYGAYMDALKSFAGPLLIYVLRKFFTIDQFHFGMFCAMMQVFGYTIMSISWIPHSVWIGAALLLTETCFYAVVHNLQATICSQSELAQFFAVDFIIQCILNCVVYIAAKTVYALTLTLWPGLFLAVCAFLYVITMVLTTLVAHYFDENSKPDRME